MNISFGRKIPLSEHKVYDKNAQKFVKATLYELDGKDESDINYIATQNGNWGTLRMFMTMDMSSKHSKLTSGSELSPIDKMVVPNNKFYTLENEEGNSIGLLEMTGVFNTRDIHYFQANPDKNYKYAGQVMLSEAVKEIADKEDAELTCNDPSDEGRVFYINACGLKPRSENAHELYMKQDGIKQFIENVQKRTQGSNVDLSA